MLRAWPQMSGWRRRGPSSCGSAAVFPSCLPGLGDGDDSRPDVKWARRWRLTAIPSRPAWRPFLPPLDGRDAVPLTFFLIRCAGGSDPGVLALRLTVHALADDRGGRCSRPPGTSPVSQNHVAAPLPDPQHGDGLRSLMGGGSRCRVGACTCILAEAMLSSLSTGVFFAGGSSGRAPMTVGAAGGGGTAWRAGFRPCRCFAGGLALLIASSCLYTWRVGRLQRRLPQLDGSPSLSGAWPAITCGRCCSAAG